MNSDSKINRFIVLIKNALREMSRLQIAVLIILLILVFLTISAAFGLFITNIFFSKKSLTISPTKFQTNYSSSDSSLPLRTPTATYSPESLNISGELERYLPELPDGFKVDYDLPYEEHTSDNGTRVFSIGFSKGPPQIGELYAVQILLEVEPSFTEAELVFKNQKDMKEKEFTVFDMDFDPADTTFIYVDKVSDNVLLLSYTSKIKNVIVTTVGYSIYDPQGSSDTLLQSLLGDLGEFHIKTLNNLAK